MDDELKENRELLDVACRIRQMPDLEPPASLLPGVMAAVRSRKAPMPWWARVRKWARTPRSFTFTPLQAAWGFALLIVVGFASSLHFGGGYGQHPGGVQGLSPASEGLGQAGLERGHIPVKLTLDMPEAHTVSVIGSFNDWLPGGYPMKREQSTWTVILDLPTGRHEYVFVVDGKTMVPDPGALMFQEDGFGNRNAVLIVGNHDENVI